MPSSKKAAQAAFLLDFTFPPCYHK